MACLIVLPLSVVPTAAFALDDQSTEQEKGFAQRLVEKLEPPPTGKKRCLALPVQKLDIFSDELFIPMLYKIESPDREMAFSSFDSVGLNISKQYRDNIEKE